MRWVCRRVRDAPAWYPRCKVRQADASLRSFAALYNRVTETYSPLAELFFARMVSAGCYRAFLLISPRTAWRHNFLSCVRIPSSTSCPLEMVPATVAKYALSPKSGLARSCRPRTRAYLAPGKTKDLSLAEILGIEQRIFALCAKGR